MSEVAPVPLSSGTDTVHLMFVKIFVPEPEARSQGYLAHRKLPPPRTMQ